MHTKHACAIWNNMITIVIPNSRPEALGVVRAYTRNSHDEDKNGIIEELKKLAADSSIACYCPIRLRGSITILMLLLINKDTACKIIQGITAHGILGLLHKVGSLASSRDPYGQRHFLGLRNVIRLLRN